MMESRVFRFRDAAPRDLTPDSTMLYCVNLFSIELLSPNPFALMDRLFCMNMNEIFANRPLNIKIFNIKFFSFFASFFFRFLKFILSDNFKC